VGTGQDAVEPGVGVVLAGRRDSAGRRGGKPGARSSPGTPAERQQIADERRAREEADRQANEAQIRAIQAEIDADKERKTEKFERKTSGVDDWSQHGDPVAWGWGAGPSHWPSPVQYAEPQELAGSATPGS
jgi:hypothetical protein